MFGFNDVVGQEAVKQRLRKEVQEGRIAHALLLCGASGTGKLPLALAYARYVCCPHRTAEDACGTCPSCVKWNKLVHPDVHFTFPVIKKNSTKAAVSDDYLSAWRMLLTHSPYFSYDQWLEELNVGTSQPYIYKDESENISHKLSLKSSEGGYKISLIWLPEKMYKDNAFGNKLLKLLEEPPAQTLFLLVSDAPEMLLPTILSRTQRIHVPPVAEADIARTLQNHYGIAPADALRIAHIANGSFVKALESIHTNEENRQFFDLFVGLMRLAYQRKIKEMKEWSEQVAGIGRERQKRLLEYAQRMIRENFVYNFRQPQMNYLTTDEEHFAVRFAPFINERNVAGIVHELTEAQVHIEQNVNAKMVFFDFALKMIVLIKNR
ncbi:MAG: DNA polymerase III subunit delta [Prevotellaceae bacterium]|jgi:DNA polymerase-3 subunit delta'|nr:DNA polymerase III subunit delta [Prevotellaceae bacterium]